MQNFEKKQKSLTLGQKMGYFGMFLLGVEKNILIFEISTLKFVWYQNFVKKWKCVKSGTKMTCLGVFLIIIWEEYCHIWNQEPQVFPIVKLWEKTKMPNFGTKNALFKYFFTGT